MILDGHVLADLGRVFICLVLGPVASGERQHVVGHVAVGETPFEDVIDDFLVVDLLI